MNISPVNNFYNISFARKPVSVYAIDKEGNYIKFESKTDAANKLGVATVRMNIAGADNWYTTKGYFIVRADEIESRDENGDIFADRQKIAKLIKFNPSQKPLYAIDKNNRYIRFNSQKEASDALGIATSCISRVLSGERSTTGGYTFIYADKVQKSVNDNFASFDRAKARELYMDKIKKFQIYAIAPDGTYKRYNSMSEAADELGVSREAIRQAVERKGKSRGYIFCKALDVEKTDEHNNYVVDEEKIEQLSNPKTSVNVKNNKEKPKGIYAFDVNGRYKKFASEKEAAEILGITPRNISRSITGKTKNLQGLIFVKAKDIEALDENGELSVREDKIKELLKSQQSQIILFE